MNIEQLIARYAILIEQARSTDDVEDALTLFAFDLRGTARARARPS